MNFRTIFSVIFFLILAGSSKAQYTMHKLLTAGYTYQNQSFGELGGKLLFLENDDVIFRAGATAMMGASNGKFAIMPRVQGDVLLNFERGVDFYHAYYFLAGAEATSKYFSPKVGATLFGLLDVTAGYAVPFGDARLNGKKLKGFNLGVSLNLPLPFLHDMLN